MFNLKSTYIYIYIYIYVYTLLCLNKASVSVDSGLHVFKPEAEATISWYSAQVLFEKKKAVIKSRLEEELHIEMAM